MIYLPKSLAPPLCPQKSHFFRCIKSFFWADSGGGHVVWHQRRHQWGDQGGDWLRGAGKTQKLGQKTTDHILLAFIYIYIYCFIDVMSDICHIICTRIEVAPLLRSQPWVWASFGGSNAAQLLLQCCTSSHLRTMICHTLYTHLQIARVITSTSRLMVGQARRPGYDHEPEVTQRLGHPDRHWNVSSWTLRREVNHQGKLLLVFWCSCWFAVVFSGCFCSCCAKSGILIARLFLFPPDLLAASLAYLTLPLVASWPCLSACPSVFACLLVWLLADYFDSWCSNRKCLFQSTHLLFWCLLKNQAMPQVSLAKRQHAMTFASSCAGFHRHTIGRRRPWKPSPRFAEHRPWLVMVHSTRGEIQCTYPSAIKHGNGKSTIHSWFSHWTLHFWGIFNYHIWFPESKWIKNMEDTVKSPALGGKPVFFGPNRRSERLNWILEGRIDGSMGWWHLTGTQWEITMGYYDIVHLPFSNFPESSQQGLSVVAMLHGFCDEVFSCFLWCRRRCGAHHTWRSLGHLGQ